MAQSQSSPWRSIGKLTTTFTPPEACFTPWIQDNDIGQFIQPFPSCVSASLGTSYPSYAASCYPEAYRSYAASYGDFGSTIVYLSPAVACPSGLKPACTSVRLSGSASLISTASGSAVAETLVGCCLPYCVCDDDFVLCSFKAASHTVVTGIRYDSACHSYSTSVTFTSTSPGGLHPAVILGFSASASVSSSSPVNTDSGPITPSMGPPTSSPQQTPSAYQSIQPAQIWSSSSPQSASSGFPTPQNTSTGLTTGSKAAIGTVVPLVTIISAFIVFFIWQRRRRGQGKSKVRADAQPSVAHPSDNLDNKSSHAAMTAIPTTTSESEQRQAPQAHEDSESDGLRSGASTLVDDSSARQTTQPRDTAISRVEDARLQ